MTSHTNELPPSCHVQNHAASLPFVCFLGTSSIADVKYGGTGFLLPFIFFLVQACGDERVFCPARPHADGVGGADGGGVGCAFAVAAVPPGKGVF